MDTMTDNMCHNGIGRLDFARVLVEMDADKEFKQTIEVQYRDKNNKEKWEEDRRHENERNVLNETEEGNMEDDVLDDELVFSENVTANEVKGSARVEEFKVKLKEAQSLVEKDPYNKEVKVKAVEALFEYNEAIKMRKTYWLKRPGWNGYEKEEVPLQFVKHFQQFLGNPSSVVDLALSDDLFSIVLTNADAEEMIKKVSEKEIMEAMFDIVDNKAPGPDGFSFVFGFHSKMVGWIRSVKVYLMLNSGDLHWTTVKNILKYLRNTKDMFLVYGGVIDWKSAKQIIFATSSTEVEYIAAYDASKEAVWVRKLISRLCMVSTIEEPISVYCDNTGAITIANESGITKGARHFRAKVHYLREVIEFGDIKLKKVHTDDNLVDPFTKALAFSKHSEHTRNIGMLPADSLM
ncbi:hypothetical protein Tco_0799175 [Tanacetum coccineum]